jgi:hypothetical protein
MLRHIIRTRPLSTKAILVLAVLAAAIPLAAWNVVTRRASAEGSRCGAGRGAARADNSVEARRAGLRRHATFRPGYSFWQHVFTIPTARSRLAAPLTDGSSRPSLERGMDGQRGARSQNE